MTAEKKGLVSVVIPAYNQENFIGEAVSSVLEQSYENIEVVVSDDASTDNTSNIIKNFAGQDNRVKAVFAEKNEGISANFNKCFDLCRGEFTAFLGGDDVMLPGKIEKQVNFLNNNHAFVLCHHDVEIFDSLTGKVIKKLSDDGKVPVTPLDWVFFTDWFFMKKMSGVIPSACLARSAYYLRARYDNRLKYKHELLFTLDNYCAEPQGKWHYTDEVLVRYRVHDNNFSSDTENRKLIREETAKLCNIAVERYPHLKKKVNSHRNYRTFLDILYGWVPAEDKRQLMKRFVKEAGCVSWLYLRFCMFLQRTGMLFIVFKPFRILYKSIYE